MKKKKVVILSLTILLILILSLVLIFNKSIFKKLKGDTSEAAYKQAGFASYEVYKSVVDAYNSDVEENNKVTYNSKLEDDQIANITQKGIELPENTKNKTIDLKGIDKLGHDNIISGAAEKVIISDMTFLHSDLTISINTKKYEVYNNYFKDSSLYIGTNSDDYIIDAFNYYNNKFWKYYLYLFGSYNNVNIYDNPKCYYLGKEEQMEISFINYYIDFYYNVDLYRNTNIINLNYYNNSANSFIDSSSYDSFIKNLNMENNQGTSGLRLYEVDNIFLKNSILPAMYIYGGNLKTIDLSNNAELEILEIKNTKLTNIDLSKNTNLERLYLDNNQLTKIDLSNNTSLNSINLQNNQIAILDLSKNTNIGGINLSNNKFGDNFKYIVKGKNYNIKDVINLPGNTSYAVGDVLNIIKIENDVLTGEREGNSSFSIDNIKFTTRLVFEVNVYDITSEEYTIDKDKKEIIYKKDFDINKVALTDGYTASLNEDKLVIKYGEDYVDTYKIVKEKEVATTKKSDSKTTTKKNDNKKESNNTIKNNNVVTTNIKNKDIYLNSNVIPSNTLRTIKGYNRNIIIENKGVKFIINGLDIKDASNSIDLDYIFIDLKEYAKKEELKNISNGYILKFKTKKELPIKVMVEVPYSNIKDKVDNKDIKVYSYNDNNYELVYKNNALNNKIDFYINKLGAYVITNDEVQKVNKAEVYYDNVNLYINNTNSKLNNKIQKQGNLTLIISIANGLLIALFILLIMYVLYAKKIKKEGDNK